LVGRSINSHSIHRCQAMPQLNIMSHRPRPQSPSDSDDPPKSFATKSRGTYQPTSKPQLLDGSSRSAPMNGLHQSNEGSGDEEQILGTFSIPTFRYDDDPPPSQRGSKSRPTGIKFKVFCTQIAFA
jgi:hypothetical protein